MERLERSISHKNTTSVEVFLELVPMKQYPPVFEVKNLVSVKRKLLNIAFVKHELICA
jgi:hypothetical protein